MYILTSLAWYVDFSEVHNCDNVEVRYVSGSGCRRFDRVVAGENFIGPSRARL